MMDQEDNNQVPVIQETVNELTEMVIKLLNEKERNPEPEDPYVATRVPFTDLVVYPELIEALPSIEEELLRTPISEAEKKKAFHLCPRNGSITTENLPKTAKEENGSRCTRSHDNRSGFTIDQEGDRGSQDIRSGIFQQSFRNTKEDRRTQTSLESEETESPCSSPGFEMSKNTRNSSICIFGRSIDPGRIEGEIRIEYSKGSIQANETWLQNKDGKIDNEAMSIDKASWNGNKLSQNESESTFLKDKGPQNGSFEITEHC
ncbi:hypothetical protein AYI70_g5596 [Smittium culicis]|uniref:Uncharacterized protein n=1 Tax=Smittium culicis TaxID=133412 RepID=A0A1R1XTR6_9FUNG|nr:hypothetical protein AYI70_g5596 [Smittium culicis]